MGEVFWVVLLGAALAWLQARSAAEAPARVPVPVEDDDERWALWEDELHDWREH